MLGDKIGQQTWQSLGVDLTGARHDERGDAFAAAGVRPDELACGPASAGLRSVIAQQVRRARELFAEGEPGARSVSPSVRRGIRLASVVYERVLDRVERNGFDAVGVPARLSVGQRIGAVASGWRQG